MRGAAPRARGQRARHRLRRAVPQHDRALRGPGRDDARSTAGCSASGRRTSWSASARAGCEVGGERYELTPTSSSFFRNHSWGNQAGRGGPRLRRAERPTQRVPGVRQWVLFHMESHGGFYFADPSGRAASGKGAILLADGRVPVVERRARARVLRRRPAAAARHASASPTPTGSERELRVRRTSAGCTARAAATSAASTTGSARASTAATTTSRARSGTSATRRRSSTPRARRSSSTTTGRRASPACESGDETGLAHFECVVIAPKPGADR